MRGDLVLHILRWNPKFPSSSIYLCLNAPTSYRQYSFIVTLISRNLYMATINAFSFLQLQTSAAHKIRNPLSTLREPSISSSATSSPPPSPSIMLARCQRCKRTMSLGENLPGVAQIGLNPCYCTRCASVVGYERWWPRHPGILLRTCSSFNRLLTLTATTPGCLPVGLQLEVHLREMG